jgi:hypothetical protein
MNASYCIFSGGSDPYVGIPAGRIHANGRSLYLYMEEGKFYTVLKQHSLYCKINVMIIRIIIFTAVFANILSLKDKN